MHAHRRALRIAMLMAAVSCPAPALIAEEADKQEDKASTTPAVLDFEMKRLHGEQAHLGDYHGHVVLMVNTASKCGLTPQYKGLQALHEKHADAGLRILGFPANNFGNQEPGSDEDIAEFCEENYGVEFDMFSKVSVKGDDQCALYRFLTSEETNPKFAGPIKWNFTKFLVNRQGEVIARFAPGVKPDSEEVTRAIKAALAEPVPADSPAAREAEAADEQDDAEE